MAKGISYPKTALGAREHVFLTHEQFALVENSIDPRFKLFARLLVDSGLRFGEATALRRRDVRVDNGRAVVAVSRAWKRADQGMKVGGPKSRKSRRSVSLPMGLSELMVKHMEGMRPDALVFTAIGGARLPNQRFHRDYWDPMKKTLAGEVNPFPTVHDLRHTHASWLLAAGVHIHVVSARLGHESGLKIGRSMPAATTASAPN